MIQRVQSLYLIISVFAIVLSYFLPFGSLESFQGVLEIRSYGLKNAAGEYLESVSSYWFHIPLFLVVLLDVFVLSQYRDRKRQIQFLRISFLLFAVSFILLSLYINSAGQLEGAGHLQMGISLLLPFAALVCNWLAAKAIRKDEALVRSVDRIR